MWMAILQPKSPENTHKNFRKTQEKATYTENQKNTKKRHIS